MGDDIIPVYMRIASTAYSSANDEYAKDLIDAGGIAKDEIERAEERATAGLGTGGRDIPEYIEA